MESRWNDSELKALVSKYADMGVDEDLAIRTYTTRILGQEPRLVLHGGGNTSVKTQTTDALGVQHTVLCVKGSGWDMARIEPPGLPAVELAPLAALARIPALSDEDLVAAQRRLLLDPYAPNPSIEAVLHAIISHMHVDHTHSNAILSLTNQHDGEDIIRDLFPETTIVPYVMPGFKLAKKIQEMLDESPGTKHLILMNHGIFTFHDDPRQSYDDMIQMCRAAEKRLDMGSARPFTPIGLPAKTPRVSEVAPIVRGALALPGEEEGRPGRWILDFRCSDQIRSFVDGAEAGDYATRGNATPDHSIRIKRFGLVAPVPTSDGLRTFASALSESVKNYIDEYAAYFERNNKRVDGGITQIDPVPRVVYVPGLGLFGVGKSAADAAVCADIAEATVDVISRAEGIGTFVSLPEEALFDIEYWSIEQAKLAKSVEKPLNRQIAIVTGGASGLGLATARLLKSEGAEVAIFDIDAERGRGAASDVGAMAVVCDVTVPDSVENAVDQVVDRFGGVDILISNAGAAFQGALKSVDDAHFREAFDLNFWSHQLVARACVRVMEAQGTGGAIVFNVSKQALNPGHNFGPYGTSKAALMALVRQYAIEHGSSGITANAVNADRVRTMLLTDEFIAERAQARGVTPEEYMRGNILKREVTARDVAEAFLHLATATKTTGAILTVDGGNVAAMVR